MVILLFLLFTPVSNFHWIDGSNFTFKNWAPNESKDEDGTFNCVEMNKSQGNWNDYICDYKREFVCEMNKSEQQIYEY